MRRAQWLNEGGSDPLYCARTPKFACAFALSTEDVLYKCVVGHGIGVRKRTKVRDRVMVMFGFGSRVRVRI